MLMSKFSIKTLLIIVVMDGLTLNLQGIYRKDAINLITHAYEPGMHNIRSFLIYTYRFSCFHALHCTRWLWTEHHEVGILPLEHQEIWPHYQGS